MTNTETDGHSALYHNPGLKFLYTNTPKPSSSTNQPTLLPVRNSSVAYLSLVGRIISTRVTASETSRVYPNKDPWAIRQKHTPLHSTRQHDCMLMFYQAKRLCNASQVGCMYLKQVMSNRKTPQAPVQQSLWQTHIGQVGTEARWREPHIMSSKLPTAGG